VLHSSPVASGDTTVQRVAEIKETRQMRKPAFTIVEALTALAILATLVGLLVPAILAARKNADHMTVPSVAEDSEPPESWTLCTVKHSGHWFVVGDKWGMHHPDCPCRSRTPEAE
jgi:hypothetical protein